MLCVANLEQLTNKPSKIKCLNGRIWQRITVTKIETTLFTFFSHIVKIHWYIKYLQDSEQIPNYFQLTKLA